MDKKRTFKLNKIVRDGIVLSTQQQGGVVDYKTVKGKDKIRLLVAKLSEEVAELRADKTPSLDELADVKEIIEQLVVDTGHTNDELQRVQDAKNQRIGSLSGGVYVRTMTLPSSNKWAQYYASDPKRFPEGA